MYNDTISNSGEGVQINSETGNDSTGDSGFQAVLLNNTFYNDPSHPDDRAGSSTATRTTVARRDCWR